MTLNPDFIANIVVGMIAYDAVKWAFRALKIGISSRLLAPSKPPKGGFSEIGNNVIDLTHKNRG